ncbi:hypothetical protein M378DRAFT_161009, partial [Amanita muscaria Koide BX008]
MLSNLFAIKSGLRCRWRRASNALETKRGHVSLPRPSDSSLYTLEGLLARLGNRSTKCEFEELALGKRQF